MDLSAHVREGPPGPRTATPAWVWPVLFAVALILGWVRGELAHNHDVAWLWLATERMLHGDVVGSDIAELNPPLVLWLMVPPVVAGQLSGLSYAGCYDLYVSLLAAVSTMICEKLLAPRLPDPVPRAATVLLIAAVLLGPVGYDFGQRDHLVIIFILPFVLYVALGLRPDRASFRLDLAVAAFSAIGFLLKPHYALLSAASLLLLMIRERSLRPAFSTIYLAMLGMAAIYAAVICLAFPQWLALSRIAAQVYFAYDPPISEVARKLVERLLVVSALYLAIRRASPGFGGRLSRNLLLCAAVLDVATFLQLKGWRYHWIPGDLTALLAVGAAIVFSAELPVRRLAWNAGLFVLMLAFILKGEVLLLLGHRGVQARLDADMRTTATAIRLAHGEAFLALTTSLGPVFPGIVDTGGSWASRGPCQWLAPGAVRLEAGDAAQRAAGHRIHALAAHWAAEDIQRYRPSVIALSPRNNQSLPGDFDWVGYYSVDPAFRASWKDYCPDKPIGRWLIYRRCHEGGGGASSYAGSATASANAWASAARR